MNVLLGRSSIVGFWVVKNGGILHDFALQDGAILLRQPEKGSKWVFASLKCGR